MTIPPQKVEKEKTEEQKAWEAAAYSKERLAAVAQGKMTLRQLHMFTGKDMRAMASVGYELYGQGRYKEARIVFEGLAVLDPQESYYLSAVGATYVAEDDLPMALQLFNTALTLNPKDSSAYVNRGEVYLRQGKYDEAATDLMKVVELDPKFQDAMTLRARGLARVALEKIAKDKEELAAKAKPAPKAAPAGDTGKSPAAKTAPGKGASKKRK